MKNKINIKIMYRLLLVIFSSFGIYLALIDKSLDSFMGDGTALNFYTLQSNILVIFVELILLIDTIRKKYKKDFLYLSESLMLIKYITTVAISITFLVFWSMLAPFLGINYIFTPSNIFVHTFTPLLMIVDFFVFDQDTKVKKMSIKLTLIIPICYFIFSLIRAELSNTTLTRWLTLSILVYRY